VNTQTSPKEIPATSGRLHLTEKLRAYWALIKSRQTLLLLATGVTGYLTARPHSTSLTEAMLMLISLFAAISGTTALNMVADRDVDARMERTSGRPLPSNALSPDEAALFGSLLVALGLGIAVWLGILFALIIAAGAVFDLLVYTLWLKRRSPWSILFGGISGGMPILAGRVLGIGQVDELGLVLALSVLAWIPAHIMTLAMKYADDYRRAGIPTWPTVYGFDSARRFIALTNALWVVALVVAGCMLRMSPYSLGLLSLSGLTMLAFSLYAVWRPSPRLNYTLFKAASIYMLGSMILITVGVL
jgi:protoheme IX farnesyltransferase